MSRNELTSWQVAPAEHEIANYDEPMIRYRQQVEKFIKQIATKSLLKKPFYTISTNVLCADTQSSKEIDPNDRDLYLPLEIAITKWSLCQDKENIKSLVWMINPGPPTRGCNCRALEHKKIHKIDFDPNDHIMNEYIQPNLKKIVAEINSFLTADRLFFSQSLKFVRQDLGCLKWLNRETGYKWKPINVLSLEDLYTVLLRRLDPTTSVFIGQGFARHRLQNFRNVYDLKYQCDYHKTKAKEENGECGHCAKALSLTSSIRFLEDVAEFANPFENQEEEKTVPEQGG